MGNLQSFWGQIDLNSVSQIHSISEGFLDFLKTTKTEWEVKDYIFRKLLHFRFSDLSKISSASPGLGFIEDLDDGCIAAGVFGTSNIQKRGLSIIGCPIDLDNVELGPRSPGLIPESDISTVRFSPLNEDVRDEWMSTDVSIHGLRILKDNSRRSFTLGESRKEPGYFIAPAPEKKAAKSKKVKKQYDLVVGSAAPEGKDKKPHYSEAFLNSIGMTEKELNSATLSLVPASMPNEMGSDRSLIQGFGARELLPVYASLKTLTDLTRPEDTVVVIFHTQKGECSRKNHNKEITEKVAESILKKVVEKVSENAVKDIFEFSRILNVTDLELKQSKTSQEVPAKPLPIGKGTIIGTTGGSSRSQRLLGIIEDSLEKAGIPYVKSPKNYEFHSGGTIGTAFSKSIPEAVNMARVVSVSRNFCSAVSKIDLWAAYRTILAYSTH
ncbi:hypothetical protein IX51_03080 [uncultured archaeon]|nr:hypothetical protein IX51_03080 [uncultured archaeon]